MKPITDDEKQLVLARLVKDLNRLRTDAGDAGCDFLAFLIASAQDEAPKPAGAAGRRDLAGSNLNTTAILHGDDFLHDVGFRFRV
jgi:hypothetical protein